ncbi:MAG: DUF2203 domain-containing protein [Thermoplasmata archaeon]
MARSEDDARSVMPQPAHLWTVAEANLRLPSLNELLPQLRAWVVRLRTVHEEIERLATFWGKEIDSGDNPDREQKARLDAEWENLTKRLEEAIGGLQTEGIEIKDLDTGLVDFYGLQNDEVVFLCWQRGEDEVGFYHTLDGGYRTRRQIPEPAKRAPRAASGRS